MSTPEGKPGQVAVYIDFDNIVMSRYDELHGREAFRNDNAGIASPRALVRQRLVEARIDLGMILDYATSFGSVVMSRAYADWSRPVNRDYATDTLRHSIDLVQLFPARGTKNGADIRLAIDATDDLAQYPNITHVFVVAGDSDYVALAQRCRRHGRMVIGVGANKSVGRFWEWACDEFRYYDALAASTITPESVVMLSEHAPTAPSESVPDTSTFLRALRLVQMGLTQDWFRPNLLKIQMKRLDPSFEERSLGFKSFGDYLRSMPQLVRVESDQSGGRVYPLDSGVAHALNSDPASTAETGSHLLEASQPPSSTAGTSTAAERIRRELNLSVTTVVGLHTELLAIGAIRALWSRADNQGPACLNIAGITLELVREGLAEALARQVGNLLLLTVPLWLRDETMSSQPNTELRGLDDDQLLEVLHLLLAGRIKHRFFPEVVTVEDAVAALYGADQVPPDVRTHYEKGMAQAGLDAVRDAIGGLVIPPPILWDAADAFSKVAPEIAISNVDELAAAMADAFREMDRDPDTVPMRTVYDVLVEANLLRRGDGAVAIAEEDRQDASVVVTGILDVWARRCAEAGIALKSSDAVTMEAIYRLVLTDPYDYQWREWLRDTIEGAAPSAVPSG